MAKLYFKVSSDYDKVIKLREEIKRLEDQLKSMNKNIDPKAFNKIQKELNSSRKEFQQITNSAAIAGAEIDNKFRKKIFNSSQTVNKLSNSLINQRVVIQRLKEEVKQLTASYKATGNDNLLSKLNSKRDALAQEQSALFNLQTEQRRAQLSVRQLRDEYASLDQKLINSTGAVNSFGSSLKNMVIGAGGLYAMQSLSREIIKVRGEFQQLQTSLETILNSKERADGLMKQIVDYAAKTPFNLTEVATGAKQLLSYGIGADSVIDELKMMGDIASGVKAPVGDLVYLYGTLKAQGRAMTVDIRQFAGRGIPIYEELAKVLKVSVKEVGELVTAGKVGFPEVQKAFQNMTKEGGKFFDLTAKNAESVTGKMSNLEDIIDQKLNEIGTKSEGLIYGSIEGLTTLVDHYEIIGKSLVSLVATYGAYKVAITLANVSLKGWTASQLLQYKALLITEKAQKLLNATILKNPYILTTTLIVGFVTAMWALSDSTSSAEKAQKELNDKLDEFAKKQDDKKKKVSELINSIQDETETELAKIKAYQELISIAPEVTKMYDLEKLKILELTEANRTLNQSRDEERKGFLKNEIDKKKSLIEEAKKRHNKDVVGYVMSEMGPSQPIYYNASEDIRNYISSVKELEKEYAKILELENKLESNQEQEKTPIRNLSTLKKELENLKKEEELAAENTINAVRVQIKNLEQEIANFGQKRNKISLFPEFDSFNVKQVDYLSKEKLQEFNEVYKTFLEKRESIRLKYDKDRYLLNKSGANPAKLKIADKNERKEIADLDAEMISKNEAFQKWADGIISLSISKIQELLQSTREALATSNIGEENKVILEAKIKALEVQLRAKNGENKDEGNYEGTIKALNEVSKFSKNTEKSFKGLNSTIGDTLGTVSTVSNATILVITGIDKLVNGVTSGIETTSRAATTAIKAVETASIILAVLSAALQIITEVFSMFDKSKKKEEEAQRRAEMLNYTQELINNSMEKRLELLKKIHGVELEIQSAQTKQFLENQKKIIDGTMNRVNPFLQKKGEDNNLSLADLGITSIEQLYDAYMGEGEIGTKVANLIQNHGYKWEGTGLKELINSYEAYKEAIENHEKAVKESLTGYSFENLENETEDLLMGDLDSIGDSFEEKMKKATIQGIRKGLNEKELLKWYEKFTNYSKDGLDKDEVKELRSEYEDFMSKAQEEYKKILEELGIAEYDSQGQSASKGFETISQETASELNGRFTDMQRSMIEIKTLLKEEVLEDIKDLKSNSSQLIYNTEEIINIQKSSYYELVQIRENTEAIIKPIKNMSDKINEIEKNTRKL